MKRFLLLITLFLIVIPAFSQIRAGRQVDVVNTSVKAIVEDPRSVDSWVFGPRLRINAEFVGVQNIRDLTFIVDENGYSIPIKLMKNDMNAEKRFVEKRYMKGDILIIEGDLEMIPVGSMEYRGLGNAIIVASNPHLGSSSSGNSYETQTEKSIVAYVNDRPNTTPETLPDTHGPEEPKLDPRASFPGMAKKDDKATTPHSATEAGEGFKAGQPDGNTPEGKTEGSANVHVKGRSVLGNLPKPAYNAQAEGIVVVQIKVDQPGTVTEAIPGAEGTTTTDKTLWNAARSAALKARFNRSASAPNSQTGTLTYIFKLK